MWLYQIQGLIIISASITGVTWYSAKKEKPLASHKKEDAYAFKIFKFKLRESPYNSFNQILWFNITFLLLVISFTIFPLISQ